MGLAAHGGHGIGPMDVLGLGRNNAHFMPSSAHGTKLPPLAEDNMRGILA